MTFVDLVSLTISSGKGGAGASSFRREKFVPKGGPDGGNGGKGGNVVFQANTNLQTLMDLKIRKKLKHKTDFQVKVENASVKMVKMKLFKFLAEQSSKIRLDPSLLT